MDIEVLYCHTCRLGWLKKRALPEGYYEKIYFKKERFLEGGYRDYLSEKDIIEKNFARYFQIIEPHLEGRRILDFGCGPGIFLNYIRNIGYSPVGFDISSFAVGYCNNQLKIPCFSNIKDLSEAAPFDAICFFDSLEHLEDPGKTVEWAKEMLNEGGAVIVYTPNFDSLLNRFMGKSWHHFKREHWYYFNKTSLSLLLEKHGLKTVTCTKIGKYISINGILERLIYSLSSKKSFNTINLFRNRFIFINTDFILLIAKKS
jgi:2-polyprenyl-3-methyl-5-hydroxy-6-metoxy-1,4-benzoquinol methylase